jgi:hypothetical protein
MKQNKKGIKISDNVTTDVLEERKEFGRNQ